jgi:hypothetical protein
MQITNLTKVQPTYLRNPRKTEELKIIPQIQNTLMTMTHLMMKTMMMNLN